MIDELGYQGMVGLSLAMYLWLVAAGLTIAFGVLGVLNFAHGSLYMLGAYLAFTLYGRTGVNFWLAILLAMAGVGALGFLLERFFLRYLYGLDVAYQLILTFGFVLILDDAAKIIWGGQFMIPPMPSMFEGGVILFGRTFPIYNLFIILSGVLVALGLWLFLDRTWWGRLIRASASDREMASAIGVNVSMVFSVVFILASMLAALGGALGIPVRVVAPGIGSSIIIQAFVVSIIGGLGNLRGAFVGALALGLLSAYGTRFFPTFELFLMYALMAVVLLVRPQGLFVRSRS